MNPWTKTAIAAFVAFSLGNIAVAPAAFADKVKVCTEETTTTDSPSRGWKTETETVNTQTSSCNSNSNTGYTEVSTDTTVTNPGGKQPPAKN